MDESNFDDLVKFLGIADRNGTADIRSNIGATHVRFEFGNMPEHEAALATVLAALALIGLAFWLYRREGQVALWKKLVLATLRGLTICMAFAMLLEPRLAADRETVERASTIVLWDDSLSMSLCDRYLSDARRHAVAEAAQITSSLDLSDVPRAEIAWRIVEKADLLRRLAEKNELKVYAWSRGARLLKRDFTRADVKPRGEGTDLATAMRTVLEKESGGGKIAAVVAITDGRLNEGEGPKAVASMLGDRAIPFYAIGVGDPTPPKNLELAELIVNERAYKNDPLIIEGRVRHSGYSGEKVDVEFLLAPESNPTRTEKVRVEQVELHADGTTEKVSFTHVPKECGSYIVTLRVPARDEEVNKEDNQKAAEVKVVDDETKVLLIAGSPSFEFRFLRNILVRDKTVKLSSYLQTADINIPEEISKQIDTLPRSKEQLMTFDVVVLMDPNPSAFDRELADNLKWFVGGDDKGMGGGGGLLFVAGEKYTTSLFRMEDLRSLLDLMPIVPDLELADSLRGPWTEAWPFKLTEEAEENSITRLDPSLARSKLIWPKLPGAFWHYPVLREKPGGAVLVRHADSRTSGREPPLVTAHFYGRGRAIFNATDETWRWRAVAPKSYDRFWVQALRFLAEGKLVGGGGRVSLMVEKAEFSSGEPIRVRARAKSHDPQKPYDAKELVARVTNPDTGEETTLTLKGVEGNPGRFEGNFEPKETGKYELSLKLPDASFDEKPAVAKLTVKRSEAEFTNPRLDEETLREIAISTGGAYVEMLAADASAPAPDPRHQGAPRTEPVTVKSLPDKIPDRTELVSQPSEPLPLWDNRVTLILGCVLLGVEWFFRKRCRMV
ncbi:hypothetical protein HY251_02675 [bacterium]|nr:hypothetical protein [bacterium]